MFGLALAASGQAVSQNWLETRAAVEELVEASRFDAAVERGDDLIESARTEFGETSRELADSHMLIARAQFASRGLVATEASILKALDIYERNFGPLSTELVEPYIALGDNYHAAGDHALAIGAYSEARSIVRRAFGLLDPRQTEIIGKLSETALSSGDLDQALDFQREALDVVQRRYGELSEEFLAANYAYGAWLTDHSLFRHAWLQYNGMRQLLGDMYEDDEVALIEPLVELLRHSAENFRRSGGSQLSHRSDPNELEEALELLEDLPEANPRLEAEIWRALGDWNVAFGRDWDVEEAYLTAWERLGSAEDGAMLRRAWFSNVVPVYSVGLASRVLSAELDDPWGRLEAEFAVNPQGRAENIEIVESSPPGLLDDAARRQILTSRYRPRIVNGRIVTSPARISWDFKYDPRFAVDLAAAETDR